MVKEFGEIAVKLSRNPLGIIALLLVLVYGIAGYVATCDGWRDSERQILVWFIVLFPVLVVLMFWQLVVWHPRKLYGPSDYADDDTFMEATRKEGIIPPQSFTKEMKEPWKLVRLELAQTSERQIELGESEKGILSTLWTKQVNRFPDYSGVWTFRVNNNDPDFLAFRESASKLISHGWVSETDKGQIYLTRKGFEYCKDHHNELPAQKWWPEEKIDEDKLAQVLG